MKFFVFCLQFISSLEGLGMFFSSAALIRRLRSNTETVFAYIFTGHFDLNFEKPKSSRKALIAVWFEFLFLSHSFFFPNWCISKRDVIYLL